MTDHTTTPILCKCGCGQFVPIPKYPSWQRQYISGHQPAAHRPIAERFWEKVDVRDPNDCWEWRGALDRKGYGQIKLRSYKRGQSHRVAYELHYGDLPDDKLVCHTCDNPRCVNPAHLFLGTYQDNHDDMHQKGRHPHGNTHPHVKLSDEQVAEIRAKYAAGIPQRALAAEYGTTQKYISSIVTFRKRKS